MRARATQWRRALQELPLWLVTLASGLLFAAGATFTSGGGGKPATMETGLVVTVPFHISEGNVLKVDTRTGEYVEKVK